MTTARHHPRPPTDEEWKLRAACRGRDPELWFALGKGAHGYNHRHLHATQQARAICLQCPVRLECLRYALDTDARWGAWGGLTQNQRARITGKRPLG
jgi:WhiB family redox-sensing transcriptional regulator